MFVIDALTMTLSILAYWLLIGITESLFQFYWPHRARLFFLLSALGSLGLMVAGIISCFQTPQTILLPIGAPILFFHLQLDQLSGFFLLLLGCGSLGVSIFSNGYLRHLPPVKLRLLVLFYHLFLIGMTLVFIANDAYSFMVGWEVMTLSSYFLVVTDYQETENRRAGFLYLLIAHVGAIAILLSFVVLQKGQANYTFAAMRLTHLSPYWASIAFLLALFGFAAKAGLLPLHIWLPEAHPAAPSPVSALMSGVMLKTAVYGLLRVTFDLLHIQLAWWGVFVLVLGLLTALYGVIFAAVQTDMKKLLAYSSMENMGIIMAGFGLTLIFHAYNEDLMAAVALTATLYHCMNHAFFKSLLFLGTGNVLHATGEKNLGKLGGLIHRMPWVAVLVLIGIFSSAGVPPLNGFISEWLLLQAFLFFPNLPIAYIAMLMPIAAAAIVLAAAISGFVMVKFYGIIFLGRPREKELYQAQDVTFSERLGLLWFAVGCVLFGVLPVIILLPLAQVNLELIHHTISNSPLHHLLFLAPVSSAQARYSPLLFFAVVACSISFVFVAIRLFFHGRKRRAPAWDCGFAQLTPRMQDTAEGFGQPVKQIFSAVFKIERTMPDAFTTTPIYKSKIQDRLWFWFYLPIAKIVKWLAEKLGLLQQGKISIYLLYSFLTLLVLIIFVR